jgi:hypothetical protein
MNTTPCNNCIGNFVLFPKNTRLNTKPIKTSSSLYTLNKSASIVANMKGYGRTGDSKTIGGPGDQGYGGVDMKHGGYFRYIMRKRGMALGGTNADGQHVGGCGCN